MNMVYMREFSLMIDLRGRYRWTEFQNFETLARTFRIFFVPVITNNLRSHYNVKEFDIKHNEVQGIINIAKDYFRFLMNDKYNFD